MKRFKFLLPALVLISCNASKTRYLDENGNGLTSNEFQSRWRSRAVQYARWDYINDTARVATLSHPRYERLRLTYSSFKSNLERLQERISRKTQSFCSSTLS